MSSPRTTPTGSLFGSRTIRVDLDVRDELSRRKLKGEIGYGDAIRRVLDENRLEEKLSRGGLTSQEMGELHWMRAVQS